MWKSWTNGILGTWLVVAAFLSFSPTGNMWNNLITGLIVGIIGFVMIKEKSWQGWTAGIVGALVFITAFIPALQLHNANLWKDLIAGILIAVAGYGALGHLDDTKHHDVSHA